MKSKVNIYDGEQLLGTPDVSEDGRWSFDVQGLSVRDHVFKAETLDGKVESSDWAVTVQQPPLYEDFESGPGGTIGSGGSMEFPTMTVTVQLALTVVEVEAYKEVSPMITSRSLVLWGGARGRGWEGYYCSLSVVLGP